MTIMKLLIATYYSINRIPMTLPLQGSTIIKQETMKYVWLAKQCMVKITKKIRIHSKTYQICSAFQLKRLYDKITNPPYGLSCRL